VGQSRHLLKVYTPALKINDNYLQATDIAIGVVLGTARLAPLKHHHRCPNHHLQLINL